MTLYQNLYFQKIRAKKFITMLKLIVIDKEYDIDVVAHKSNLGIETAKKYINSKELILEFLTEDEYNQFLAYVNIVKNKAKLQEAVEKARLYEALIKDILETRFKIEEICIRNNITKSNFEKFMADEEYLKENFGEDIIPKIKFRIEETSIIRRSTPRDKNIIEEAWELNVVKDKTNYLDPYEFKVLKIVSNYLMSGADMKFVSQKFGMPYQMIYNYITDPKVKALIKENHYNDLQSCINIEDILRGQDLNQKRDLIQQAVFALKQADYNIKNASEEANIPLGLFERILKQDLLSIMYSRNELEMIKGLFTKEESKKRK